LIQMALYALTIIPPTGERETSRSKQMRVARIYSVVTD
jgi:hypothetical protein